MKCWSFLHNIALLRITAPFSPFSMPSSNIIGFGTWRLEKKLFPCELFIYLLWKSYSKYSDEKTRNTLVNAKRRLRTPAGHFVLFAGHTFPYYRSSHLSCFYIINLSILSSVLSLLASCITLPLESASQATWPAYRSRRLITLIWSHTRQFVFSCITTVTIHYSFSLPLQTQNSSFPQIFSSIVLLPFHPPDWLHGLQVFFVFSGMSVLTLALCARLSWLLVSC